MRTWWAELWGWAVAAGMLSNHANPMPHPQYHALGTLCRVYELPGGAYSSVHKHHAKLMSLVPRLWEWSLLIMGLDRSQVSAYVALSLLAGKGHTASVPSPQVAQALVSTLMQFTALVLPSLPSQAAGRVGPSLQWVWQAVRADRHPTHCRSSPVLPTWPTQATVWQCLCLPPASSLPATM